VAKGFGQEMMMRVGRGRRQRAGGWPFGGARRGRSEGPADVDLRPHSLVPTASLSLCPGHKTQSSVTTTARMGTPESSVDFGAPLARA